MSNCCGLPECSCIKCNPAYHSHPPAWGTDDQDLVEDHSITPPEGFGPGTFGCHELLHMVSFLEHAVEEEVCKHPSVMIDPDWHLESQRALLALRRLYQLIGSKHL